MILAKIIKIIKQVQGGPATTIASAPRSFGYSLGVSSCILHPNPLPPDKPNRPGKA